MELQRDIAIQAVQNKKNENLILAGEIKKELQDKKILTDQMV